MREDVGIRKDFEWRIIGKLIHRRNGGKAFLTKEARIATVGRIFMVEAQGVSETETPLLQGDSDTAPPLCRGTGALKVSQCELAWL